MYLLDADDRNRNRHVAHYRQPLTPCWLPQRPQSRRRWPSANLVPTAGASQRRNNTHSHSSSSVSDCAIRAHCVHCALQPPSWKGTHAHLISASNGSKRRSVAADCALNYAPRRMLRSKRIAKLHHPFIKTMLTHFNHCQTSIIHLRPAANWFVSVSHKRSVRMDIILSGGVVELKHSQSLLYPTACTYFGARMSQTKIDHQIRSRYKSLSHSRS